MLAAMVNNNVRCYNESMEFAERVEDTLDDEHKVKPMGLRPCACCTQRACTRLPCCSHAWTMD